MDFLSQDNDADFVGHKTKENSLLMGFDLAFLTPRRGFHIRISLLTFSANPLQN